MKKALFIFLCVFILLSCLTVAYADDASLRISLAKQILEKSSITYSYGQTHHNSYSNDGAFARDNIVDTANGKAAKRSNYGTAPGGKCLFKCKYVTGYSGFGSEIWFINDK